MIPVADSVAGPPRRSRPGEDPLVGRERELATLLLAWERATRGHGSLILITGRIGAGRTRMAEELCGFARADGGRVLFCEPEGATIETPVTRRPGDRPDTLIERVLDCAARDPVLVVLRDLQHADAMTFTTLRLAASRARQAKVVVAATLVDRSHRLPVFAKAGAVRVQLDPLDTAAVGAFAERLLGRPLPRGIVARLLARTRGNPLFVRELVRLLDEEGWLGDEGDAIAAIRSWRRVEGVIVRRLARLSAPCRRLVELAAAQGNQFDV